MAACDRRLGNRSVMMVVATLVLAASVSLAEASNGQTDKRAPLSGNDIYQKQQVLAANGAGADPFVPMLPSWFHDGLTWPIRPVSQALVGLVGEQRFLDMELSFLRLFNPRLTSLDQVKGRHMAYVPLQDAIVVVGLYLLAVFTSRAILMRSKPPVSTDKSGQASTAMFVYNLVQVALCTFMLVKLMYDIMVNDYSFILNSFTLERTHLLDMVHLYYLSKVLDFVDTAFIIARRKWRQLSFLHLYHHSSIFLFLWMQCNAGYDGDIYFSIALNCLIHMLMYTYYGAKAINVVVPLTLKKSLTKAQLTQFVLIICQCIVDLVFTTEERFPPRLVALHVCYMLSMYALFQNFSTQTYKEQKGE
eukprot:m.188966 g.188966  ORF g.188966 m.188966 type:complete len:361 (-) comp14789_c7_seq2:245-1327(-)